MTAPTRITSEGAFVLILDPRFASTQAGAAVYDLSAAAAAGVLSFAGRTGAVMPEAGDYDAAQVTYGVGGNVEAAVGGAQATADGAQADATQALLDALQALAAAAAAQADANSAQAAADSALADAAAAQGTADAAQSTADAAQADATAALASLGALDTDGVANASGVAGATATAALDALLADVATRATTAALAAETSARIAADALLAPLASPALTGAPTAPTAAPGDGSAQLATTAFVAAAIDDIPNPDWGDLGGTLSNQTDLQAALNLKAPLASPAFTGNPTAPTPATSDNDTSVATTAFVQAVAALCLKAYNSGGAVTGARAWFGTATTDASGNWTANITAAGFSSTPTVWVSGELNTATVTDQVWATVRTRSSTSISGSALRGVVLAVVGATLRAAAAGATVHVLAIGT